MKTMLQNQANKNWDKEERSKEEGSKLEAESEFEGEEMKKTEAKEMEEEEGWKGGLVQMDHGSKILKTVGLV